MQWHKEGPSELIAPDTDGQEWYGKVRNKGVPTSQSTLYMIRALNRGCALSA